MAVQSQVRPSFVTQHLGRHWSPAFKITAPENIANHLNIQNIASLKSTVKVKKKAFLTVDTVLISLCFEVKKLPEIILSHTSR